MKSLKESLFKQHITNITKQIDYPEDEYQYYNHAISGIASLIDDCDSKDEIEGMFGDIEDGYTGVCGRVETAVNDQCSNGIYSEDEWEDIFWDHVIQDVIDVFRDNNYDEKSVRDAFDIK